MIVKSRAYYGFSITMLNWHNIRSLGETDDPQKRESFQPPEHKVGQGVGKTIWRKRLFQEYSCLSLSCHFLYQQLHFEEHMFNTCSREAAINTVILLPGKDDVRGKEKGIYENQTFYITFTPGSFLMYLDKIRRSKFNMYSMILFPWKNNHFYFNICGIDQKPPIWNTWEKEKEKEKE